MYESRSSCASFGLTGGSGKGAGGNVVKRVNAASECGIQVTEGDRLRRGRLGLDTRGGEVDRELEFFFWAVDWIWGKESHGLDFRSSNSKRLAMKSSSLIAQRLMCRLQLDCTPKRRPQS